jgi:hypothetical protein
MFIRYLGGGIGHRATRCTMTQQDDSGSKTHNDAELEEQTEDEPFAAAGVALEDLVDVEEDPQEEDGDDDENPDEENQEEAEDYGYRDEERDDDDDDDERGEDDDNEGPVDDEEYDIEDIYGEVGFAPL